MGEKNWIRTFAITIAVVGGIGSFIAGQVFAIPDILAYLPTKNYNWTIVLVGEIGTIFSSAFFLALASIFDQTRSIALNTWFIRNDKGSKEKEAA